MATVVGDGDGRRRWLKGAGNGSDENSRQEADELVVIGS
jgi:hypothetical protein